jgi:Bacterial protein of unknown function (Gcw_chp)
MIYKKYLHWFLNSSKSLKMRKSKYLILLLFFGLVSFCQESEAIKDLIIVEKEKKLDVSVLLVNRYIWRGQSFGGDYVAVQPEINYAITKKFSIGIWASSNFKNSYYFQDGTSAKGYQEIDLSLTYQVNKFLKIQLADYYWPTVEKIEGTNNSYFNYGNYSVKTVDATLIFDFSATWRPLKITLSTFLAGKDFRTDDDGGNPKQNFTTYFETSYVLENIFKNLSKKAIQNISLEPVIGLVLNNKAQYYSSGDYDKPSLINLGIKISKEFEINKRFKLPIFLNYIHNASIENTEQFGRNFAILDFKLSYK